MSGELDKISGKVKEVAGDVSSNTKLEARAWFNKALAK